MAGNTMMTALSVLSTMLAMAPSAAAHMIMKSPVPFGHPDNSPLRPDGSDYPCKIPAASIAGAQINEFKVGENQTLSFEGTAVHGGGSCQLSVTFDNPPTKASKFKVIQSLVGGCPSTQRQGSSSTFSFQVPPELPNGDAVFAWTWFNHIGQREMYMNCGLVKITGGKDDKSAFESLPDMAVANIQAGTGNCKTTEGFDYEFDNPGKYIQTTGPGPFMKLCGGPASGSSGSGAPAAPGGASGPAPAAPAPPPAAAEPPAPAQPTALTSTVQTMVTVTTSAFCPSPTGAAPTDPPPAPGGPQASGAPVAGGSTCATDGQVVCNGETQFGICNHGKVVWQAVSPGTKCQDGKLSKRDLHFPYHRAAHRAHRRGF